MGELGCGDDVEGGLAGTPPPAYRRTPPRFA
jgi:hypothetical protein